MRVRKPRLRIEQPCEIRAGRTLVVRVPPQTFLQCFREQLVNLRISPKILVRTLLKTLGDRKSTSIPSIENGSANRPCDHEYNEKRCEQR